MIREDWRVAMHALQIIAERGPGLAYAHQEASEDRQLAESLKNIPRA